MKRFLIAATLGLALLSTSAFACQKGGKGLWQAFYSVTPSAEQEERMESVMAAHREAMREHFKKRGCCGELSGFEKSSFDRAAFVAPHQERMAVMIEARANLFSQIHGILTPEQREAFVAAIGDRQSACGQKRSKGDCPQAKKRSGCGDKKSGCGERQQKKQRGHCGS